MLTIPAALALGNCVIYKPSEKAPLTAQKLMDLMLSAGFPAGVIQIVHGSKYEVDALCDHPAVGAVTFVGSSAVAEHVANRCQAAGKRVCALGGAKNHAVALPDCDISLAARDIVASFTACAGQRCFATSVLLLAGDGSKEVRDAFTDTLVKEIVTLAKLLTSGQKKAQIGPLACAVDKERYDEKN